MNYSLIVGLVDCTVRSLTATEARAKMVELGLELCTRSSDVGLGLARYKSRQHPGVVLEMSL